MNIMLSHSFSFQVRELPQKLSQASAGDLTGYWHCQFPDSHGSHHLNSWYLALRRGEVIFSGTQQLSWPALLSTLQRYGSSLRRNDAQQALDRLAGLSSLGERLNALYQLNLIRPSEVLHALRLKVLSDFDVYLFNSAGKAQFLAVTDLVADSFLPTGFALAQLVVEAQKRYALWCHLKAQIPSMGSIPILNSQAVQQSYLTATQKQRLEQLVSGHNTLNEIAVTLGQDTLETAKFFARLIGERFVTLQLPDVVRKPSILIVDDSPLLLEQFKRLVTGWGYRVQICQDPMAAVTEMLSMDPALVFIDINMPQINGFELVKAIRRRPELATIPLIMLTAEKTLSNNWRAQWSGCRFLTKPLTPTEAPKFQIDLRLLLEELVPLPAQSQLESNPT